MISVNNNIYESLYKKRKIIRLINTTCMCNCIIYDDNDDDDDDMKPCDFNENKFEFANCS